MTKTKLKERVIGIHPRILEAIEKQDDIALCMKINSLLLNYIADMNLITQKEYYEISHELAELLIA